MTYKQFHLVATVTTDNPKAVGPILENLIGGHGSLEAGAPVDRGRKGEFFIHAEMEGVSAKDLNRSLLSALRRVEKRTTLRAEWSSGNVVERYFDYVLKKKTTGK
jgi:hypothetical protein